MKLNVDLTSFIEYLSKEDFKTLLLAVVRSNEVMSNEDINDVLIEALDVMTDDMCFGYTKAQRKKLKELSKLKDD